MLGISVVRLINDLVVYTMVTIVLIKTGGGGGRGVWIVVRTTFLGVVDGWALLVEVLVVMGP